MSLTSSDGTTAQGGRAPEPLSRLVEWAVTGLLVLGGLLVAAIGLAVYGGADREWITTLVAEGYIESTELTNAELIDVTYALAWWIGIGLIVTGLLSVVAGIAFLAYRRRMDDERTGPDTTTNALVGGIVTAVTSFVPFSPVLGGLASGYLQGTDRTDGVRVGAYAGLVAAVPVVVLFAFLIVGAVAVATELSLAAPMSIGVAGLVVGLIVLVAYLVVLSALGGYLGVALGERADESDDTAI